MTDLTLEELAELQRELDGSTPGAWKTWGLSVLADTGGDSDVEKATPVAHGVGPRTFDIDLICASQRALPALLAMARELVRLKSALEFLDVHCRCDLVGQARVLPVGTQNSLALARELGWPDPLPPSERKGEG